MCEIIYLTKLFIIINEQRMYLIINIFFLISSCRICTVDAETQTDAAPCDAQQRNCPCRLRNSLSCAARLNDCPSCSESNCSRRHTNLHPRRHTNHHSRRHTNLYSRRHTNLTAACDSSEERNCHSCLGNSLTERSGGIFNHIEKSYESESQSNECVGSCERGVEINRCLDTYDETDDTTESYDEGKLVSGYVDESINENPNLVNDLNVTVNSPDEESNLCSKVTEFAGSDEIIDDFDGKTMVSANFMDQPTRTYGLYFASSTQTSPVKYLTLTNPMCASATQTSPHNEDKNGSQFCKKDVYLSSATQTAPILDIIPHDSALYYNNVSMQPRRSLFDESDIDEAIITLDDGDPPDDRMIILQEDSDDIIEDDRISCLTGKVRRAPKLSETLRSSSIETQTDVKPILCADITTQTKNQLFAELDTTHSYTQTTDQLFPELNFNHTFTQTCSNSMDESLSLVNSHTQTSDRKAGLL